MFLVNSREVFLNLWEFLLVSMLPSINPQQRNVLAHHGVLILHNSLMASANLLINGGILRKICALTGIAITCRALVSLSLTNQPHPLPWIPARVTFILFLRSSILPYVLLIASARVPLGGSPPPEPFGAKFSQKRVWFK